MTSPPRVSSYISNYDQIRVIYNHKMITWHNNGTNLLNHKISVSYNSQRSQNPVCEDEINFEVLDSLPDTGSAAERLEHRSKPRLLCYGCPSSNRAANFGQIMCIVYALVLLISESDVLLN